MFERILIAVDGSPKSEKTILIALDMAERYGSIVTVVHVREYERYEGSDVDLGSPDPGGGARRPGPRAVPRTRASRRTARSAA